MNQWKHVLVSGLVLISPTIAAQELKMVTDPEAYALYSLLVPASWARVSREPILLQRETETRHHSCDNRNPNAERQWWWTAPSAERSYRLSHPLLRPDAPHRLSAG